ncbi:hypothetical protein [Aestuariibacter sp. A3R04]|uniref:hypothetical protein n=1 Tax=Aestuariibacter sp. A3R04 TaxID=2841571 RepID=UPI001C098E46|nr:hypothetical protein [Aestuariibacter sp. A3R04]MBU3022886.1 hypothetical protein [Aestuariibacter sp. A3R04]
MSKSLHMNVIAEDEEITRAQANLHLREGCYHAQGFLYTELVPFKILIKLIGLEQA